ncbi:hypothetical protein Purlil1_11277 [Purpureocillium lilacinum]|uniref:2EXR domain-containing protein n=1 Tax=Purpureocillium lilacinum TaxID=33203 RepID=A0ABR0BKY8_PURLI|nr:hypothetical protein Purlil1_11277 [Purpureocillium lilacinum]
MASKSQCCTIPDQNGTTSIGVLGFSSHLAGNALKQAGGLRAHVDPVPLADPSQTPSETPSFEETTKLPPEIRMQIWDILLREDDGPALLPYRRDCLQPRNLSELDEGYIADGVNLRAEFDPHLLDKTHVAIPIATINREARGAALFWMRQKMHASEVRYCEDHHCSVFARVFDRRRDTLYIEADEVMTFSWNPIDRLSDHGLPFKGSTITRLAISETSFRNLDFATFGMILDGAPDTNVVLVVVGAQPRWENNGLNVQRRWVAEDAGDYRLSWDLSRQRFEVAAGQGSGNTVEYAWMKAICETWIEWLVQHRRGALEIRPVHAIRQGPGAAG